MTDQKLNKLSNIKFYLFDLDGVLCNQKDLENDNGLGDKISIMSDFNDFISSMDLHSGILTAGENEQIHDFCDKAGFKEIYTSSFDKVTLARKIMLKHNINFENIFYIGDSILDVPLLQRAGFSAAPKNARREVKRVVDYVCKNETTLDMLKEILKLVIDSKSN
jgi:3-deoxy-D-manno-octulosonate 8-phosphate phosphatase (KDO 8-P phosphatase)